MANRMQEARERQKTLLTECSGCHNLYYRNPKVNTASKNHYCTKRCFGISIRTVNYKPRRPQSAKITGRCWNCDSRFMFREYWVGHSRGKFCKYECRKAYGKKRTKGTDIEIAMRSILEKNGIAYLEQRTVRINGVRIRPDFLVKEGSIAIYCDGDYWHNYPYGVDRDKRADALLREIGITPIRLWGSQITRSPNLCGLLVRSAIDSNV